MMLPSESVALAAKTVMTIGCDDEGGMLVAMFSSAADLGRSGREGLALGTMFAMLALATMQRDAGQSEAAGRTVRRLAEAFPNDREIAALARQLQ